MTITLYPYTLTMQVDTAPALVGAGFATIIIASLIPIIKGANLNISGAGPFNQRAEVTNHRHESNLNCVQGFHEM